MKNKNQNQAGERTQYTPGPRWIYRGAEYSLGPWINHDNVVNSYSSNPTVNVAICSGLSESQALANARLIAAAPELLAILKGISPLLPEDVKEKVELAIAKAEGQS